MASLCPSAPPAAAGVTRSRLEACPLEARGDGYHEVAFRALGSSCNLFFQAPDPGSAEAFRAAALDWLATFEARFSRFLPDSLVSRINANAGKCWTAVDRTAEMLLDLCAHAHFLTGGAFDATSLPLSLLWDWKTGHERLPSDAEIAAARRLVGWHEVRRRPGEVFLPNEGMQLDFGGVGKEFAVDCLLQVALGMGLDNVMVDLGGDIAVAGEPPEGGGWYVGLEDPNQPGETFCGVRLRGGTAVASSGDYRRCFLHDGTRYGHIIDGRTGRPSRSGTTGASVLSKRCVTAGVLSTAAVLRGGDEAIRLLDTTPGAEGCLWHRGRLFESRRFRRSLLPDGWDADEDPVSNNPPNPP